MILKQLRDTIAPLRSGVEVKYEIRLKDGTHVQGEPLIGELSYRFEDNGGTIVLHSIEER